MITRDHSLGQRVKSVLINDINDNDIAALRNSIDSLLSQAPNILWLTPVILLVCFLFTRYTGIM
jgi:hypothetical protein